MFSSDSFSDFSLIDFRRYSLFNPSVVKPQIDSALKHVDNFDRSGPNRRVCTETALLDELKAKQSLLGSVVSVPKWKKNRASINTTPTSMGRRFLDSQYFAGYQYHRMSWMNSESSLKAFSFIRKSFSLAQLISMNTKSQKLSLLLVQYFKLIMILNHDMRLVLIEIEM
jgi:hypothetical protein